MVCVSAFRALPECGSESGSNQVHAALPSLAGSRTLQLSSELSQLPGWDSNL